MANKRNGKNGNGKSLESWIWDAACSIRGAKDAPKYKEFILPLIECSRRPPRHSWNGLKKSIH